MVVVKDNGFEKKWRFTGHCGTGLIATVRTLKRQSSEQA